MVEQDLSQIHTKRSPSGGPSTTINQQEDIGQHIQLLGKVLVLESTVTRKVLVVCLNTIAEWALYKWYKLKHILNFMILRLYRCIKLQKREQING